MRRGFRAVCLGGFVTCLAFGGAAFGQGSDAALKDRVNQLLVKLDADKADLRDAAQKSLIDLGPRVLPLIADAEKSGSADRKARIAKIRDALNLADEQTNLGASKVTLKGKAIRLTEALRELQAKTGNIVNDLREQLGTDVTNPALDLDIVDKPFFEALDIIAEKAGLSVSFYSGDGSIGVMAGATPGAPAMAKPLLVYTGPFRVQFRQIGIIRDFAGGPSTANAQFEVAWEPRLRPMLLALKADKITITTDEGKAVTPMITEESGDVVLRQENPAAELNINVAAPSRSAKELTSLKVKADVTLPAGLRTFRFKSLEGKDVVIKDNDISVTLESTSIEEQVWKVNVMVAYPAGGPAFESYRQGLFNNRIWLQKADGSRFEHNGGLNNTGSDEGKLSFEYLFVDVPGKLSDYGLVYETPSKVIPIPLEFEFKKVPLP
jgi:hypothetical protein